MLFSYKYVPHQMEKMQEFIDFIFFEVWCKAPEGKPFCLDLFVANAELHEVMQNFYFADVRYEDKDKRKSKPQPTASKFYNAVLDIYCLFSSLDQSQINQFKQWYKANNNIEKACANDPAVPVARYADITLLHPDLSKQLALFFKKLYSKNLLNLAALKEKIGQINDHYKNFLAFNGMKKGGKCPFCGVEKIKGTFEKGREAYDHFLPKALYPFNSINFRNLVPVCHECNSTKLSKDPVRTATGRRRKIFYPYAPTSQSIQVTINLSKPDIDHLTSDDIQITFGPSTVSEEIETWKDIYGIEKRYKAKCFSNDAKDWLEQIRILCDSGKQPEESLAMVRQQAEKDPIANSNFLKIAFLEGCHRVGMWS